MASFCDGALAFGGGSHEIIGFGGASCGSDDAAGLSGLPSDLAGGSIFVSAVLSDAVDLSSLDDVPVLLDESSAEDAESDA